MGIMDHTKFLEVKQLAYRENETPGEVPHRRKRERSNLASSLQKRRFLPVACPVAYA
jgi:hypothetical protein